jgi:hypothetical protein
MMKQFKRFLWIYLLPVVLMTACKKVSTDNVSVTAKVSFPEITLNGPAIQIVVLGSPYVDAGAKLKDDITGAITDIQPSSSNVNTTVPGLYIVTFTAANSNGFETNATRLVAVAAVVPGSVNRAGTYLRTATGVNCYITKLADGVYKLENPAGFAGSPDMVVYMVETAANVYSCPSQPVSGYGNVAVTNINFTATGVSWVVLAAGFGSGTRTFVK